MLHACIYRMLAWDTINLLPLLHYCQITSWGKEVFKLHWLIAVENKQGKFDDCFDKLTNLVVGKSVLKYMTVCQEFSFNNVKVWPH